jgi:Protein of unknown function (DUF3618)
VTDQQQPDVQELREQIEHTRSELAETIGALTAKTDVKARAKEKAGVLTQQAVRSTSSVAAVARERLAVAGSAVGSLRPPRRVQPYQVAAAALGSTAVALGVLARRQQR